MGWLRPAPPFLTTARLALHAPHRRHAAAWVALRSECADWLQRWEPKWDSDHLSHGWYRRYCRRLRDRVAVGRWYGVHVFLREDEQLVGAINLVNMRPYPVGTAEIGFWLGQRYAGRGLMGEALAAFLPYAFHTLSLKRIQAVCMPENRTSQRLLTRSGFAYEGIARQSLCIDGRWQDHWQYARLDTDIAQRNIGDMQGRAQPEDSLAIR